MFVNYTNIISKLCGKMFTIQPKIVHLKISNMDAFNQSLFPARPGKYMRKWQQQETNKDTYTCRYINIVQAFIKKKTSLLSIWF